MTTTTGRYTRLPRSQRRVQLLDAAQEVFVEAGYHAAAMDTIAERAGVSKPVLYQHFPSKQALYLALLDQHCNAIVSMVEQALADNQDNKQRVAAAIDAYFSFFEQNGSPARLVFESDLTGEEPVRARLDSVALRCAEAIAAVIAEEAGLRTDQALLLGMALTGAAMQSAKHWVTQGQSVPRAEATRLVSALNWRGLGGFPRTQAG